MDNHRDRQSLVLVVAILVVSLGFVALWLKPTVEERLAPEPVRAWVAIQPEGDDVASIGPVALPAGTAFTLHAVLEAQGRGAQPIYYTRAPGLRFVRAQMPGATASEVAETVPASSIKLWDRGPHVKVRWFTVEGPRPYVPMTESASVGDFALENFFQVDWSPTWSVPGSIEGGFANHLRTDDRAARLGRDFGTQRYHVRIELYSSEDSTLPAMRIPSATVDVLSTEADRFSTVVATLPGPLAGPSRVFGLSQIELPAAAAADELAALRALAGNGLAFSRLTVLRDQLRGEGDATWQTIDLGENQQWGTDVGAGDLLRVGERVVVLYDDQGTPGQLDYEDLCFDYVDGAAIRALGDVFSGEGLVVEIRRAT